ncbi:hypothetical protein A2V56_03765 [Candidatus Woesebacteria bacterium RBG_19FT_COMBO_42_9]|uniref:Alpha/beta hydrolase n=1 Tax=Candidatus Woesebacteria bacterium RBG_16_42_24 TaxID=1802485 RepID=A0A1F7XKA9_9BACT|nr:MAG: hypothetical protein A2V97_00475 [Candidatus Woesebacteria bacterium RBG_16_42_24]OGM17583.1 MAG: hypothetical protein A2V56_03765 [Candidatus Woesebacteria bacterium RBG_19FT_COMBO_42_9]OGM67090.1 MAG: hypothetical protein A2985_02450 [Candidatus Woesebacteria bacterium RIFCSPLOWO2_01_FULL_43_11]
MTKRSLKIRTADGFILDGIFCKPNDSKEGVIFAHGMTVDKNEEGIFVRAEPKLNMLGFATIRFDFMGK